MKDNSTYSSPYEFKGRIPLKHAIPLGIQHVLAMFVGNLTPLIIICGACGITSDEPALYVTLLQNAMLVAGLVTLVQPFSIMITHDFFIFLWIGAATTVNKKVKSVITSAGISKISRGK